MEFSYRALWPRSLKNAAPIDSGKSPNRISHMRFAGIYGMAAVLPLLSAIVSASIAFAGLFSNSPSPAPATTVSPQTELEGLIESGSLTEMRWPNFSDYRSHVSNFYQSGNYGLAWIRNSGPTPQALAMIQLFKRAGMKGLRPEDYDSSIWDPRLAKLQGPQTPASISERVHFDLSTAVCAMRYISDLHIGRVSPQHFKFGLDVGPNKL